MRTFEVYRNQRGKLKCTKKGWSWPAFLFAPFWALFCGLWVAAIILFPVEIAFSAVGRALNDLEARGASADTAIVLAYLLIALGIRLFFGARGNSMKRKKWRKGGFSLVYSGKSEYAEVALAKVKAAEQAAASSLAPVAAQNTAMDEVIQHARARLQRELLHIESRSDLTQDQKIDRVITIFSTVCAAIAVQPIPFADFFILTPLQVFMGARLSAIRGIPITEAESSDILKEVIGVVGMGLLAQQAGIAAAKVFFPVVGGVATIPVVFGLTYAIGKAMDFYLEGKAAGRTPTASEVKAAWKNANARGLREGKVRQEEIERGKGNHEVPDAEPHAQSIQDS